MILLDTHVVLRLALEPETLSKAATRVIAKAYTSDGIAIASITLWEIALLIDRRELVVPSSTEEFLSALCERPGLTVLELDPQVAALSMQFPPDFPRDPGDRIIAATARAHDLQLVTRDQRLQDSPLLRTIW
jgi:PIN domain nuclease of toxin-antitoxin system